MMLRRSNSASKTTLQLALCLESISNELEWNQSRQRELCGESLKHSGMNGVCPTSSKALQKKRLAPKGSSVVLSEITMLLRNKPSMRYLAPAAGNARRYAAAVMNACGGVERRLDEQRELEKAARMAKVEEIEQVPDDLIDMGSDWECINAQSYSPDEALCNCDDVPVRSASKSSVRLNVTRRPSLRSTTMTSTHSTHRQISFKRTLSEKTAQRSMNFDRSPKIAPTATAPSRLRDPRLVVDSGKMGFLKKIPSFRPRNAQLLSELKGDFQLPSSSSLELSAEIDEFDAGPNGAASRRAPLKSRIEIFNQLHTDYEVGCSRLGEAICMLGHPEYRPEWISDIVDSTYNGRSNLDKTEFFEFLDTYEARYGVFLHDLFDEVDMEGSGVLREGELVVFIRLLGVSPFGSVVRDLSLEACGGKGPVSVSFNIFVRLYNIIKRRFGFTLSEASELKRAFVRYDCDRDGFINREELARCVWWMGYPTASLDSVVDSFEKSSRGNSPSVFDITMYFQMMRAKREQELKNALQFFSGETLAAGQLTPDVLPNLFDHLGYPAVRAELIDELIAKHFVSTAAKVTFPEMYFLLDEVRRGKCLLEKERAEISKAFHQFCGESSRLGGIRLKAAVRWLGYMQSLEDIQDALATCLVEEHDAVTYEEFLVMLRGFTLQDLNKVHDEWRRAQAFGVCSSYEAIAIFFRFGIVLTPEELESLAKVRLDLKRFANCFSLFRLRMRDTMRDDGGLTSSEMRRIRDVFAKHDEDGSGILETQELRVMFEDMFPRITSDPATHAYVKGLLHEMSSSGDGSLTFTDFKDMMRAAQDAKDAAKLDEENKTRRALGMSRSEVAESRKLFKMIDIDGSGDVTFEELETSLSGLLCLGIKERDELYAAVCSFAAHGEEVLKFPEFLRLMQSLQDRNWANLDKFMNGANADAGEASQSDFDNDGDGIDEF